MKDIIEKSKSKSLGQEETTKLFDSFLSNDDSLISDEDILAYLESTSSRALSEEELVGAVLSLKKHMLAPSLPEELKKIEFTDTCGTGGSGLDTFNTSTLSAFVIAGAGVYVAKHGNRAASSRCGSADLLQAMKVNIDCSFETTIRCALEAKFAFLFAPKHHPATKRVVPLRKQLGKRTIFNFLGPLVNPLGAKYQVLGVSKKEMLEPMAKALLKLGSKNALVVRGLDGLDEITLCEETDVIEIKANKIEKYKLNPKDFGLELAIPKDIQGDIPERSAQVAANILAGEKGAKRDLICLNSAAAFYVSGKVKNIKEGIDLAKHSIDSSAAKKCLQKVIDVTNG